MSCLSETLSVFGQLSDAQMSAGRLADVFRAVYITGNILLIVAFALSAIVLIGRNREQQVMYPWRILAPLMVIQATLLAAMMLMDTLALWKSAFAVISILHLLSGIASCMVFYVIRTSREVEAAPAHTLLEEALHPTVLRTQFLEEELKQKNLQLLEAERTAKIGFGYWELESNHIYLSEMAYYILGIPRDTELSGSRLLEQVHPADIRFVEDSFNKNLRNQVFKDFYFRVLTMQMEVRHILIRGEVTRNADGAPVCVKGTLQDVSDLRNHMLKIEIQNKKLRRIAWLQSHRMRSPVATILGMADLLNENDPMDPVNTEIIGNIKSLAHKLDTMIHEVDVLTRGKEKEPHI